MDKNRISGIINKVLSDSNIESVEVFFEENDVIRPKTFIEADSILRNYSKRNRFMINIGMFTIVLHTHSALLRVVIMIICIVGKSFQSLL